MNKRTAAYHDFATGETIGLWDMRARLGRHADWRVARDHYAAELG